jgi:hypothetical protein
MNEIKVGTRLRPKRGNSKSEYRVIKIIDLDYIIYSTSIGADGTYCMDLFDVLKRFVVVPEAEPVKEVDILEITRNMVG